MNMMAMLKKAQDMQKGLATAQAELAKTEVVGTAGGGSVTVTLLGNHEFVSIRLKPEAVDPNEVEMLEDLIKVAFREALEKANAITKQKMGAVTGGLNIPGLGF
jgi:nucleoid-associated protein EbfC